MIKKIKKECFEAFVHSRLSGLGVDALNDGQKMFKTNKQDNQMVQSINIAKKPLLDIDYINNKIETHESVIIANQYHRWYTKLCDLMHLKIETKILSKIFGKEVQIKEGEHIINEVIGFRLLDLSGDTRLDYKSLIDEYRETLKDTELNYLVRYMELVADNIYKRYWKS